MAGFNRFTGRATATFGPHVWWLRLAAVAGAGGTIFALAAILQAT